MVLKGLIARRGTLTTNRTMDRTMLVKGRTQEVVETDKQISDREPDQNEGCSLALQPDLFQSPWWCL